MDAGTKQFVRDRAGNRCEYCHVHQRGFSIAFHVEHVIARQHHGDDHESNLALACHRCNRFKGPNLSGIDPDTGELTPLFHPRVDAWDEHFLLQDDGLIVGQTPTGRATADVLQMNSRERQQVRRITGPSRL